MATKNKSNTGDKISKSGFIRTLADNTPAKEVIAKAKEAGLELNEKYVWTVQSAMRPKAKSAKPAVPSNAAQPSGAAATSGRKAKKSKSKKKSQATKQPAVAAGSVKPVTRSPSTTSATEQKMKAMIVELGTARADEVYRSVRRELDALVSR